MCDFFWFSEQIVGCSNLNSEELLPDLQHEQNTFPYASSTG